MKKTLLRDPIRRGSIPRFQSIYELASGVNLGDMEVGGKDSHTRKQKLVPERMCQWYGVTISMFVDAVLELEG